MQTATWDGVVTSGFLSEAVERIRHSIADAARDGQWDRMLELLRAHGKWINATRIGGASFFTPLHQAAFRGAPTEVVQHLLDLGAWRTLQNAQGDRAIDVAKRRQHEHLFDILAPALFREVPLDVLGKIQGHFHQVIRDRICRIEHWDRLRLPELEPLLEMETPEVWFAVPGMGGGFRYRLVDLGVQGKLISESWCRFVEGSGQRHEVTAAGSRLLDEGFV